MNPLLLNQEVQEFLHAQSQRRPEEIALQKSPFPGVTSSELAAQVDARQRIRYKLPTWHATEGIYYPKRLSTEQSSSEVTAAYKASLVPEGAQVLDMTGGFGVDSFAFAQRAARVKYCERDEELVAIVEHNARQLCAAGLPLSRVEFYHGDGRDGVTAAEEGEFDLIYLDPARRDGSRKTYLLEDCEPNVLELLPDLWAKTDRIMLKLAPMLDIHVVQKQLPLLREIYIISVGGECKELLCLLEKNPPQLPDMSVKITAVAKDQGQVSFHAEDEASSVAMESKPLRFLYEPDAALLKAGAFKWIAQHYRLFKLHRHTHLYTSEALVENFMGRVTQIEEVIPFSMYKKTKLQPSGNVIVRNFPLKPADIRKKYHVGEDSSRYIYFCTGSDGQLLVVVSRPLTPPETTNFMASVADI